MSLRRATLGLSFVWALAGCGSSDSEAPADAGSQDGAADEGDSALPDTFGDCGAATCEVSLSAFTKVAGAIPYCAPDRASLDVACANGSTWSGATCAGVTTVREVYGFPGDYFECSYDAASGALVGAKWAPDNHPTQVAGTQLSTACVLEDLCADGGASDAASE